MYTGTVHPHPDHITFDEETIAEQMKEREENPKMKIDEPDTPYRYAEGDDDEEGTRYVHSTSLRFCHSL